VNLEALNTAFAWAAIIAAVLTTISTVGLWWTGSILDHRKQQEISNLRSSLSKLQPRTLTTAQRQKLISELSGREKSKVGFSTKMLDGEAKHFAEQLAEVLKGVGWTVVEPMNSTLLDDFDGKINIVFSNAKDAPVDVKLAKTAEALCQILSNAEIPCKMGPVREGSLSGQFEVGAIFLLIGSRPSIQ